MINKTKKILDLKKQYDTLKQGKESLLDMIDDIEMIDGVYNSNAIENSTLTLPDTEKILLDLEVSIAFELYTDSASSTSSIIESRESFPFLRVKYFCCKSSIV